ncbi:MAG: hypothetical protein HOV76_06325 [Hamadaea sp.]|nr:hypothetical protein [Hamadaea sp.]
MTAYAGRRDELIERFTEALRLGEEGLRWCSVSTVPGDPDTIWVTQIWTDKEAHDTATRSEAMVAASRGVMDLLAGPPAGSYGEVAYLHDAAAA